MKNRMYILALAVAAVIQGCATTTPMQQVAQSSCLANAKRAVAMHYPVDRYPVITALDSSGLTADEASKVQRVAAMCNEQMARRSTSQVAADAAKLPPMPISF